jgi:hypothetical protein
VTPTKMSISVDQCSRHTRVANCGEFFVSCTLSLKRDVSFNGKKFLIATPSGDFRTLTFSPTSKPKGSIPADETDCLQSANH